MKVPALLDSLEYGPAPESASLAAQWLDDRKRTLGHFIGGKFVAGSGHFDSVNPATGKAIARVAQATTAEVGAAVAAARRAFGKWSKTPGHERAKVLYAIARQVQKNARLLAVLETLDNGKPIRESRDIDVPLVARHFYHHAGWAQLAATEFAGHGPVGVVGQIIPWNFPLLMLAWKIAPAIAMGNTVVLKPAEFTSVTAIAFAELCVAAGVPPGVVNIITGDGKVGAAIVEHPGVDKIAFTGSTDVGRILRNATAGSGKKLSLELGGKSPFVVFEDADLDSAVEGVVDAIWFNQGQVCCAGSRLLVQESVHDRFVRKLRDRMEKLRVGDPLDKAVDIGAIVAPVQLKRIKELVAKGVEEGAKLWQPSWACPRDGCFYPPTLFTNVSPAATIAQVEIFGPVLVAMAFRTPAEAIQLANNTRFGLAASVWTENVNLALDYARKIKAGTVWINSTNLFDAAAGFGGYRESGFGREGGREGIWEYVKREPSGKAPALKKVKPLKGAPAIDRTAKLFVGGKQARPDSGYSLVVHDAQGRPMGEVGDGNRKDIRNAVEAAHAAESWGFATAHNRAQILYYVAENLSVRAEEFARRIERMTGREGRVEVDAAVSRLFTYAAWADKFDGAVHSVPLRGLTIATIEPVGVIGLACPEEFPLLGFVSLVAPAIALGNTVVAVPSEKHPLAATDLTQVLETSDLPPGVVNIVTGKKDALARVLAGHDDVEGVWCFGTNEGAKAVEAASAGNMKRTWCEWGAKRNWLDRADGEGPEFLRAATQTKNIWTPSGE
ncbi:MAG: aldehyde dehydrogenase family protein [Planctomycetes bacterium]|nr:aldehyde dehydrogenase family protein [Planctomycetota bacterium]